MFDETRAFYNDAYATAGFSAQRRYPNEELCRFIGSRFSGLDRNKRKRRKVLEVGCGSGANLWMLANEGFDVCGLDFSIDSLDLAASMLQHWNKDARLIEGDMTALPFEPASIDVVVDVFSSYCLNDDGFRRLGSEVNRVLKPGGMFFTYTPSKGSDAFNNHAPATLIDASTLDGIKRSTSPYFGNDYPFRFASSEDIASALAPMRIEQCERIGRTYRNGEEYFEFLSAIAVR